MSTADTTGSSAGGLREHSDATMPSAGYDPSGQPVEPTGSSGATPSVSDSSGAGAGGDHNLASQAGNALQNAQAAMGAINDAQRAVQAAENGDMGQAVISGAKAAAAATGGYGKAANMAADAMGLGKKKKGGEDDNDTSGEKGENDDSDSEKDSAEADGTESSDSSEDKDKGDGSQSAGGVGKPNPEKNSDKGGDKQGGGLSDAAKKNIVIGGANAASQAAPMIMLMLFLEWLKSLVAMAMAALANLINMAIAIAVAVAQALIGVAVAVAALTGGAIGATVVLGFIVFMVAATAVTVGGGVVAANTSAEIARHDTLMESCVDTVKVQENAVIGAGQTSSMQMEQNAQKIYSVLAAWGMPNENIAGMLGNYEIESNIDPTMIETKHAVEPYFYGPAKREIESTTNFEIMKIDPAYAERFPGVKKAVYVGLGIQQWTGQGNTNLRNFAKASGKEWYDLELQLAFLRSEGSKSTDGDLEPYIRNKQPSPGDAAEYYMNTYERPATKTSPERRAAAEKWFAKMTGWTADQALGDSLITMAGAASQAQLDANVSAVHSAVKDCNEAKSIGGIADNSSLAMAMLSYSWPTTDQGKIKDGTSGSGPYGNHGNGEGNDGTPLYRELMGYIFPGDPYFQSCDRSVAVAVRWSGTDDTFPAGNTDAQLAYMATSPKWAEVTDWGGDPNKLQPGDLLIRADGTVNHIVMYTGHELIAQVFGSQADPAANNASGSYGTRSPGAGTWYTGSTGLNTYRAFRSTGLEPSPKYKNYVPTAATMGNTSVDPNAAAGDGVAMKPVNAPMGAYFGKKGVWARYHTGVDFPAEAGTPVYAAMGGTVVPCSSNAQSWAGPNCIGISHGQFGSTLYAHMNSKSVTVGQTVTKGQQIGVVGTQGNVTGAHLHFEYYPPGRTVGSVYQATDPITWLRIHGVSV